MSKLVSLYFDFLILSSYDLWNKFKSDPSYSEEDYWNDIIRREDLNETVDSLKLKFIDAIVGYQNVIGIAMNLYQNGYKTGILSNHSISWFEAIKKKLSLNKSFDDSNVIISQAVKVAKPNREIYEHLVSIFPDIQPNDIIFFDDKQANVDAAKELGISAYKYNSLTDQEDKIWEILGKHGISRKET